MFALLWIWCYDFFLFVSLSSDFFSAHSHTLTQRNPKCCPKMKSFLLFYSFWFLIIPKSIRFFFLCCAPDWFLLYPDSFWYSNNSIAMRRTRDSRRMKTRLWKSHHLFRSLNRKVKLTETKRNETKYIFVFLLFCAHAHTILILDSLQASVHIIQRGPNRNASTFDCVLLPSWSYYHSCCIFLFLLFYF